MLIKIIGVGFCAVIINIILKQNKPEFCLLSNVCAGIIIFMLAIDGLKEIVASIMDMKNMTGVSTEIIGPVLKVIGVGYITEFASDIAEESGNKSIAGKIILGGKIAICSLALPIIKKLISAILSLI